MRVQRAKGGKVLEDDGDNEVEEYTRADDSKGETADTRLVSHVREQAGMMCDEATT